MSDPSITSSPDVQTEGQDPVSDRRLPRRTFIALAASSAAGLTLAARAGLLSYASAQAQANATPTASQTLTFPATPDATPAASPQASPAASPAATPEAPYGVLEVIDNQRPAYTETPVEGGGLNMLLSGPLNSNYNPTAFRQDFQIMCSYLDPLVWIDEVTMKPKPWLAESWEWSNDNTVITYKLRPRIRWHDDSRFHARDVVFSLYAYRDDIDSAVRNLFTSMVDAEIVDSETVKVTLSQPDENWLLNASSQLIFQRKQYNDFWNDQPEGERTLSTFSWRDVTPAGTGPWKINDGIGEQLTFVRNESYWAGPAHFETLTLTVVEDAEARRAAWLAGAVDLTWPLPSADMPLVRNSPGKLYIADAASVMFAAFNFSNPARVRPDLLSDLRIRQALNLGIDRERYALEVFGGRVFFERAGTVAQPWAYDTSVFNPRRDLAQARGLLKDAGFEDRNGDGIAEDKDGESLNLSVIVRNTVRPELALILRLIAIDLLEIGVMLDVRQLSAERFDTEWIDTHEFDLIAFAYNLYPGFTDFDLYGSAWDIRTNPQGWNPGGYANETVDIAIKDILGATSEEDQIAALSVLQRETNEDLFGLWFGFPRDLILVRPDILGYSPNKSWQTLDTRKLWRVSAGTT